jgi:hypothetical protein
MRGKEEGRESESRVGVRERVLRRACVTWDLFHFKGYCVIVGVVMAVSIVVMMSQTKVTVTDILDIASSSTLLIPSITPTRLHVLMYSTRIDSERHMCSTLASYILHGHHPVILGFWIFLPFC